MLVGGVEGCVHAEVDAHAIAHDGFAVEGLPYLDRGVDVEEGDDDALEGFERRPGVDLCMLVYCFAELGECAEVEELWGKEVGDYESVGRR